MSSPPAADSPDPTRDATAVPATSPTNAGRSENLTRVAVYRRTIGASLERVWENVLDWEHLPWLHDDSFSDIQLREAGAWGWRARAVTRQGWEIELELLVEREAGCYVTRTLEGRGAGTEIATELRFRSRNETDIQVEFWLPDVDPDNADALGAGYLHLYTQLWDEDEEMMREREVRLVSRRAAAAVDPGSVELTLGALESLRAKLPLRLEFLGEPVWLVELDGVMAAHTAVCPHLLGPLPPAGSEDDAAGTLRCPWHGYRFDARTGASCDGHGLQLKSPLRVVIEAGQVRLLAPLAG